ncbi:MBL fold metallo-hydrolase [Ectothiorhodospiraceae bacterium WFHF3C12]|nr:MBL fold metallo-hydrolase [Ectothiorhodospiraceae bacterium WFHF3C12]
MSQSLNYPFPEPPAEGATLEVAPGIHWLRLPLPFALDHINVWLLEDGDGWTLVDTGLGTDQTREHWQAVAGLVLDGQPVRRIVVTHYHPDHIGQAAWLAETHDAVVHLTDGEMAHARRVHGMADEEAGARLAELFAHHGLDTDRANALRQRGNTYRRLVPRIPDRHVTLGDGDTLAIGDRHWRVVVGRGHSPEHACLYSESGDQPVLIAGDQVLPKISSNVSVRPEAEHEDPLGEFLASLERLGALRSGTRVLPSHGGVFEGLPERCAALMHHHEAHLERLLGVLSQPGTAADMLPVLFRKGLDNHQIMFAMGESVAHLRHLEVRGLVERDGDEPVRFRRVD